MNTYTDSNGFDRLRASFREHPWVSWILALILVGLNVWVDYLNPLLILVDLVFVFVLRKEYLKSRYKTQDEILRSVLRPLADEFEAGNRRGSVDPASIEYPPVRDYVTMLIAEGSLTEFMIASHRTGMFQLTNEGYRKYKSRIAALRALAPHRSKS